MKASHLALCALLAMLVGAPARSNADVVGRKRLKQIDQSLTTRKDYDLNEIAKLLPHIFEEQGVRDAYFSGPMDIGSPVGKDDKYIFNEDLRNLMRALSTHGDQAVARHDFHRAHRVYELIVGVMLLPTGLVPPKQVPIGLSTPSRKPTLISGDLQYPDTGWPVDVGIDYLARAFDRIGTLSSSVRSAVAPVRDYLKKIKTDRRQYKHQLLSFVNVNEKRYVQNGPAIAKLTRPELK